MSTPMRNSRPKIALKELDVLRVMGQLPVAVIDDIIAVGRFPRSRVYEAVEVLHNEENKLVDSVQLGWTCDKVNRYWLTAKGLELVSGADSPGPVPVA